MTPKVTDKSTFTHHYKNNSLVVTWDAKGAAQEFTLPLGVWLHEKQISFRKWAVRQKGAQSRTIKGRGTMAVDFRKTRFHWHGKIPLEDCQNIAYVKNWDVKGWRLQLPDLTQAPLEIGDATEFETTLGAAEPGRPGTFAPRYFWLSRPDGSMGVLFSAAAPGEYHNLKLSISGGLLTLAFQDVHMEATREQMPELYMVLAIMSAKAALTAHQAIVAKEGFLQSNNRDRHWWQQPTLYITQEHLKASDTAGLTADRLLTLLDRLARWRGDSDTKSNTSGATLALDHAWADCPGDGNPNCTLFSNFEEYRSFKAALNEKGHRLLLTFSPTKISAGSHFAEECPWYLLKDERGLPLLDPDGDYFIDYTFMESKGWLQDTVEFMLGSGPEQLDADGLLVAPSWLPAQGSAKWIDPVKGTGEALWRRVLGHLYQFARDVRADSLIELEGADSIFNACCDRLAPLGLMGRRQPLDRAAIQTADIYGDILPDVQHVTLVQSAADGTKPATSKVKFPGFIYQPDSD